MPPFRKHAKLNWNPPKISRAATIPDGEWEKYRIWIHDLHQGGSTLEEIMSTIRRHCAEEGSVFNPSRKQYITRLKKWHLHRYGVPKSVTDTSPSELSPTLGDSASPLRISAEYDDLSYDDAMEIELAYSSATTPQAQSEIGGPPNKLHVAEFPLPPSMIKPATRTRGDQLPPFSFPQGHDDAEANKARALPNESSALSPSYSLQKETQAYGDVELNEAPAITNEGIACHDSVCHLCIQPVRIVQDGCYSNQEPATVLSESERQRKLDLAHFYLAAKSYDDAWRTLEELLHQSEQCSNLARLRIAVKLLQAAVTPDQYLIAKSKLLCLRLSDDDMPVASPEPQWLMHLFLGMVKRTEADFPNAFHHVRRAIELCKNATIVTHPRRDLHAHRAFTVEVEASLLQDMRVLDERVLLISPSSNAYRAAVLPEGSMRMFLQWCLNQVEEGGYYAMLSSLAETTWFQVHNIHDPKSLAAFETTLLFCFLWQKYQAAREGPWPDALVEPIEDLESHLQMPAPIIFSTILSIEADTETAKLSAVEVGCEMGQIASRAIAKLTNLIAEKVRDRFPFSRHLANKFFATYASSCNLIAPVEPQVQEYRLWMQKVVRHFALCTTPLAMRKSSITHESSPHENYGRTTAPQSDMEGVPDEEVLNNDIPLPALTRSATPIAERPKTAVIPDTEMDDIPDSSSPMDVCHTPRSSGVSSKASLRSLQLLSRVAQRLRKRGGSGASQLPSEVMDRDSHSSWSLRRLTGVPYLSDTNSIVGDGQCLDDTITEELSVWI